MLSCNVEKIAADIWFLARCELYYTDDHLWKYATVRPPYSGLPYSGHLPIEDKFLWDQSILFSYKIIPHIVDPLLLDVYGQNFAGPLY